MFSFLQSAGHFIITVVLSVIFGNTVVVSLPNNAQLVASSTAPITVEQSADSAVHIKTIVTPQVAEATTSDTIEATTTKETPAIEPQQFEITIPIQNTMPESVDNSAQIAAIQEQFKVQTDPIDARVADIRSQIESMRAEYLAHGASYTAKQEEDHQIQLKALNDEGQGLIEQRSNLDVQLADALKRL